MDRKAKTKSSPISPKEVTDAKTTSGRRKPVMIVDSEPFSIWRLGSLIPGVVVVELVSISGWMEPDAAGSVVPSMTGAIVRHEQDRRLPISPTRVL